MSDRIYGGAGRSARRRWWRVGLLVLIGFSLVGAWTALAQSIVTPTTPRPLPGSKFQGGDGNQANAPGLIDWQGLQASGRVGHTSDPQAHDDIFAGGDKELEPGEWGLTTRNGGASPPSDNILDIYRAVAHPPGGDVFLYLAFTREAGNGTTFVTFELNQDARLWTNAAGDRLPCRTTGDILISFNEHGNGADVQVERWVTDSRRGNGCARTGHLVEASNLRPNVDVQGSFNNGDAIANYLPGFLGATIPDLQFGEAAINLSTVLSDLGHPCGAFHSTWMHSRSSLSDSSQLKDFVAPQSFHVSTCKASPVLTSSASGRVNRKARGKHRLRRRLRLARSLLISDTATLSGGDDPTGTITFKLFGPNNTACSGAPALTSTSAVVGNGSYQSGAFMPLAVGTYRWVVDYSGDDNNLGAGPTGCGEDAETVVITRASPTLTTEASGPVRRRRIATGPRRHRRFRLVRVHTRQAGQATFDTATLSGGVAPTGKITFNLYGPDDTNCSGVAVSTSTATVNGNGLYNSDPYTPTAAGTYRWVATYPGDAFNNGAGPTRCGDLSETIEIAKAQPSLTTLASGATTVGEAMFDRATLSGVDPTGKIIFNVYGPNDGTCSRLPAGTSTTHVNGNNTYSSGDFIPRRAGTYRWVASYLGDANNEPVATSCSDEAEAAVVGHPTVQPSLRTTASASAPAGSAITDTAHLSNGLHPTGTISFVVYGPNGCAAQAGTSTVTVNRGNGDYTSAPFRPAKAGVYHWVATYLGDAHNHPAGPTACHEPGEIVFVSRANAAIRTLALPAVPIGGPVADAAHLSGGSKPRGKITFRLYGPNDPACSARPAFTTEKFVIGNGLYRSSTFVPKKTGRYLWVASYSGDHDNKPATTACGAEGETSVVLLRRPLLRTSASPPAFLRNARRLRAAGLSIYDSGKLAGFAPTGSITFALFGPSDPSCSGRPIFTSAIEVKGDGVYNSERFTPTASGAYRWRAVYSGDTNNNRAGPTGCGDSAEHVHVTVPADPALTTSASAAVTLGGAIHDVAHLSGGEDPTGTITFKLYGAADTGCAAHAVFNSTITVAGNNDYASASFVPTTAGAYRWVVSYSGDTSNHAAGPTACDDGAENAVVRPPNITPVVPTFSTTAGEQPTGGTSLHDTARLAGGIDPGGTITFTLFGPNAQACSGPPAFTATVAVTGNGDYRSPAFLVSLPGTYRWVATYSGDAMNAAVGPTVCGEPAETSTVSATPTPAPDQGPNVPTPPKPPPKPKPSPKPKPPLPPPPPRFTG